MQNISTVLNAIAESSDFAVVTVDDVQIIGFEPQVALGFITLSEREQESSTISTRTIVIKTSDGGQNWQQTLDPKIGGSVVADEIFFLDKDSYFFITQWQIEATFPTLYTTSDGGESWQELSAINDFLKDKEHNTFNYATNLRFRSDREGIVIAKANDLGGEEMAVYLLQTKDGGKSWEEIKELPSWYFGWQGFINWQRDNIWQVKKEFGFSILKPIGNFSDVLKS